MTGVEILIGGATLAATVAAWLLPRSPKGKRGDMPAAFKFGKVDGKVNITEVEVHGYDGFSEVGEVGPDGEFNIVRCKFFGADRTPIKVNPRSVTREEMLAGIGCVVLASIIERIGDEIRLVDPPFLLPDQLTSEDRILFSKRPDGKLQLLRALRANEPLSSDHLVENVNVDKVEWR